MHQPDVAQLPPYATLADLSSHKFQVNITTSTQIVAAEFQNQPELPGVIVTNGLELVGLISRQKFLEKMSQPYSLEIYLKYLLTMQVVNYIILVKLLVK